MTPSYAVNNGVRYRYYISAPLVQGQPNKAAKLKRIPAAEIETLIISAVRKHLAGASYSSEETPNLDLLNDAELISSHIGRVDVNQDHLAIQLVQSNLSKNSFVIPWTKRAAKRPREIILPASTSFSSRPASNPRRDPRQTCHRDREGATLAR